jgi:pSer/pThr/pTyr-binding forkhead associated (FHA) protein
MSGRGPESEAPEAPVEPAGVPPGARLVWERTDGTRPEFPLSGAPMVIGRDEGAQIRIDEPLVSREHARIEWCEDGFVVFDLGSTNFTRVNGERVMRARLEAGDELRFARAVCRLVVEPPAAGA